MAVLKGYIKPLVKASSVKLPTKNEDKAEEILSDLCYDALSGSASLDERPAVRFGDDMKNVEIELVVVGNSDKTTVARLLSETLNKYLKGYLVGIKDAPRGRLNVLIADNAQDIRYAGYHSYLAEMDI